jgi:hypothetical protein
MRSNIYLTLRRRKASSRRTHGASAAGLALALLLAACAALQLPAPRSPPPSVVLPPHRASAAPGDALPPEPAAERTPLSRLVARSAVVPAAGVPQAGFPIRLANQQVAVRGAPTAALLLSDKNPARNRAVCASPGETLPPPAQGRDVPTFLLDKRKEAAPAAAVPCEAQLATYDYYRSRLDLAQYGLANAAGPVLVGYSGQRGPDLVWDLSQLADADLPAALALWQRRIVADPTNWNHGWRLAVIDHTVADYFRGLHGSALGDSLLPRAVERKPIAG